MGRGVSRRRGGRMRARGALSLPPRRRGPLRRPGLAGAARRRARSVTGGRSRLRTSGTTPDTDRGPLWQQVISEVHVGTFTPEGTFDSAVGALDDLVEVGITAVELMPVAQFPGPAQLGLRRRVPLRRAELLRRRGRAAAVRRRLPPARARCDPRCRLQPPGSRGKRPRPRSVRTSPTATGRPWGPAVNFDGADSNDVRAYFLHNARQWFTDFHIDGLRLDAVHEIIDRSATPFLAELADAVEDLGDRITSWPRARTTTRALSLPSVREASACTPSGTMTSTTRSTPPSPASAPGTTSTSARWTTSRVQ